MKVIAVIQARWGSTRLPGKVLKDIEGKTMLARVVERVQKAKRIDELTVATSMNGKDDGIVEECRRLGAGVFRGSETDVLDRFYQAVQSRSEDAVVRITADCPLIDPEVINQVIGAFLKEKPDYASNTLVRTFPRGLDTEVVATQALTRAWREASFPYHRAHVTPYFYENPHLFRLLSVTAEGNHSHYRWTVDTQADLDFVRAVYVRLKKNENFGWQEVLQLLAAEPLLTAINDHVAQKALEEG